MISSSKIFLSLFAALLFWSQVVTAAGLTVERVSDNVYAVVGELGNRTAENLGDNATFGFVVTTQGVVLIDSGASYLGAKSLHEMIRRVTDKPVVSVINTGGQDHRWMGNDYFKRQGARVIASEAAVADQKARQRDQFILLENLVGAEGMAGTEASYADQTFSQKMVLKVGDTVFELHHVGPAHTPGDSFVWLPEQRVMFTGDIVFTERLLGVGEQSNSKQWLATFESMAAYQPAVIVPGHGHPTTLSRATADTYDYLRFLRSRVHQFMQSGGDLSAIGTIDQSRFSGLSNFKVLAGRNAQQVYTELEWE